MKKFLDNLYKNQSLVYKGFLFILTTALVVYLFPKGGKFKYDFHKGKLWQYETLYAPFDFAIHKTDEEIKQNKDEIESNHLDYFKFDVGIRDLVYEGYKERFNSYFTAEDYSESDRKYLRSNGQELLNRIYEKGVVQNTEQYKGDVLVNVVRGNQEQTILYGSLVKINQLDRVITGFLTERKLQAHGERLKSLYFDIIQPNVFFDEALTKMTLERELAKVTTTRGGVDKGKRIIAKGEVVEGEKYTMLYSLQREYQSKLWNENNYNWILLGYIILVGLTLLMLLLFLKKYRPDVFINNNKVTFIFFNVLVMIFLTTTVVKFNSHYVYVVPMCIMPLILKAFFDPRLGLFTHVLTVLILGFIVPNSFEYVFLQTIAGIVTIQTISELHKRANLFISVGQITLVYIIAYFAFYVIHEGNFNNMDWVNFGLFILNGLATLAAFPLIYIYEKLFSLVSDVSLLELSDTNAKLLKELSDKAPGTFHHSLQVANLAEAAANEIGANSMLVRVGALYHDIGKMNNPAYFTENQTTSVNPHNELSAEESARIIIAHVIEGIEMAKKNNIPDRVIDFIRTHHGTSLVYYFYREASNLDENIDKADYQYPGPIPFSKETAILMMADSVEAASKSLKNPTSTMINSFVEKIVSKQIDEGQFLNANITFKEIEQIKKVLKRKLTNIYHLRIEYPE
ncbi:7TM receptor with intracellular metal dependent phosphohydrolase [Galbibacter marinus]|uniref:7TM receptor with intracellular metal dependent phosphohydrolase n=1 Tax=Galbibacter marinus TaxID=555500 RepID=K2PS05_9FLAO|nr:HDIG domain-containing metalloprotein [Galbibacter marinus]EKF54274.1 7TM receptor with intracellular metal dependent phosphohydrolase [Galbibacter marinus]